MVYIKKGNIANATEDIIAHQVNCQGVMGSEVAKVLRNIYGDQLFDSYKKYCNYQSSQLLGKIQILTMSNRKLVCNIFAQDKYGTDKQYTEEDKFLECVRKLFLYAKKNNLSIAMPYNIGCGRGGADWIKIYKILLDESNNIGMDITLYSI